MKTKIISLYFSTAKEAENYLQQLYNTYEVATTVAQPLFSESGVYTFKVKF